MKIDRLARLPLRGASVSVCVDDAANIADLSAAATAHGTTLGCLVELDCGEEVFVETCKLLKRLPRGLKHRARLLRTAALLSHGKT